MPSPGVSVIVVSWNTRDILLRLLAGLSSGDDPDAQQLELIVVDNGSSDGSVEAIRRSFPAAKLLAQTENLGFGRGVNAGLAMATQPFVLLLNSDAQTSRASIEEVVQYMEKFPEVGILGPQVLSPERSPQPSAWRDPSLIWIALYALGLSRLKLLNFERYQERTLAEARQVDCVSGCAMMIRRELLEELGGFDEAYFMYFEDTDLCVRARRLGKQVHQAPVGEFLHEEGGTSKMVGLRTFLELRRSQILFHRSHGGVSAAIAARGLLALGSALRVPPLTALTLFGGSEQARKQLRLHLNGLAWLINPLSTLVPDVDRSR